MTKDIEATGLINTARVQRNNKRPHNNTGTTVNDVNYSMETAHLAKNQILQQAANRYDDGDWG